MSLAIKKKRGRPSKIEVAAREAAQKGTKRSESEILTEAQARFDLMYKMTTNATLGSCRALTISGGPGLGKSFGINRILESAKEKQGINYQIIKGGISGIGLYMLAYQMRESKNVILLDDADGIYEDSDALNVLKALNDTSIDRVVSWQKLTNALKEQDSPQTFIFNGAMIFITNIDMQRVLDAGKAKIHEHLAAIMSRSYYLDLKLHTTEELYAWVKYSVEKHGILKQLTCGPLTDGQVKDALSWMKEHTDDIRAISIRTAMQVGEIIKTSKTWETDARILLCR